MEETLELLYSTFQTNELNRIQELGGKELLRLMQMRKIIDENADRMADHVSRMEALESELTKLRQAMSRQIEMSRAARKYYLENKSRIITPEIIESVLEIDDIDFINEEESDDDESEDPLNPFRVNEMADRMMQENPPFLAKMMESNQKSSGAKKQRRMLPKELDAAYNGIAAGMCIYCSLLNDKCSCKCFLCNRKRNGCQCKNFFTLKQTSQAFDEMCSQAQSNSKKYGKSVSLWRQIISHQFKDEHFAQKKEFLRREFKKEVSDKCLICLRDEKVRGTCRQCKQNSVKK